MKILTDLGHPKNVHVIKNLAPLLTQKGHELHCVYREREHIKELCAAFGIAAVSRGAGAASIAGKIFYLFRTDMKLLGLARKVKPDLLLSFASPYLANLAVITRVPMIVFDDTEQNRLVQRIYRRAAGAIVVPSCFRKKLSEKQFRFAGYFELSYLHPEYFTPDPEIAGELGVEQGEKFVLIRTVAWQALHDLSHRGMVGEQLRRLVELFSKRARVFISAEGPLQETLEPLRLKTAPERIHHVMARAALVFSEGATMAAEAAVLGVPTIHCSDLRPGYIADLSDRFGLLQSYAHKDFQAALAAGMNLLQDGGEYRKGLAQKREAMLAQSVDVIEFMAWFIDRFPESVEVMKDDTQYAKRFI
jgi:predicted glycosyltransferase